MSNPFRIFERRSLLPRRKYSRLGVTSVFAGTALAIILIAGWLLEGRGDTGAQEAIVELAREADTAVVAAVANASRANRMVLLADIHESPATKRLAARAIERIVATSGLDLVVLEIGSDLQPVIDRYLDSDPEDASVLVSNERTLRAPGPASREYLEVYRTIWKLNQELGADQRIQIIAADLEGWPPARSISPADMARSAAEREQHMQERIADAMRPHPGARALIFMTGYHGLRQGTGVLQTGGSEPVQITWLAQLLGRTAPEEVYTFLVDAPVAGRATDVTAYGGTAIGDIVKRGGVSRSFVAPVTEEFDEIRRPLITRKSPGLSFELSPRDYKLSELADAYIFLR